MGLENVPRCQHVKVNGTQCGSPALRRRRHCFFHRRAQEQHARITGSQFKQARFVMPLLEDANAIQLALMQVMQLLSSAQMDHKTAGLMLYALQTASVNLRNTQFEAEEATDVVIDRDTVNATCIGGQQWFEEDFEDDEPEEGEGEETEALAVGVEEKLEATGAICAAEAKRPKHVSLEAARRQIQELALNWVVETVAAHPRARAQLIGEDQISKDSSTE